MQTKSVIIDNIHYINFFMFNICTEFFSRLKIPAEIGVRFIHPCVLYVIKYGNSLRSPYETHEQ